MSAVLCAERPSYAVLRLTTAPASSCGCLAASCLRTNRAEKVRPICERELHFLEGALMKNPKAYTTWEHRLWTVRKVSADISNPPVPSRHPPSCSLSAARQCRCRRAAALREISEVRRAEFPLLGLPASHGTARAGDGGGGAGLHGGEGRIELLELLRMALALQTPAAGLLFPLQPHL